MQEMPSLPNYPTDLNDLEWAVADEILGGPPKLGRPPRCARRAGRGAIFYRVRTGGSWRLLPHDLPPWRIVYYDFARRRAAGLFEKLHAALRDAARLQSGKKKPRRPRSTDSQSVRTTRRGGVRGDAAGKKIVGRKRHLLVDTDGLILKIRVRAASVQDRDGAALVLDQIDEPLSKLELIWADAGDSGPKLQDGMATRFAARPLRLEIVRRSDTQKGFAVLPRRWVVETHLRLAQ